MREKQIEQKLFSAVRSHGGICPKLISPGMDGMPDRLILFPGGHLGFVEVKAPGKTLRPLQERRREQLTSLGFMVFVLDDLGQIQRIMEEISNV